MAFVLALPRIFVTRYQSLPALKGRHPLDSPLGVAFCLMQHNAVNWNFY